MEDAKVSTKYVGIFLMVAASLLSCYHTHRFVMSATFDKKDEFQPTVICEPQTNRIKGNTVTKSIPTDRSNIKVFIFYFVFIPPGAEHWLFLVTAQLKDLKASGLLNVASLNVIAATDPSSHTGTVDMASLAGAVKEIAGNGATFTPRYGNRYEYWGVYQMWGKAMSQDIQQQEDSIFLYMHSKGMVNHGNVTAEKRAKSDGPLFKHVIEPWRDVLNRFQTVPGLDKAGFSITRGGYVYFNYIWVRSSYVTRLEAPIERPLSRHPGGGGGNASMNIVDRYYYEHWIGHTTDQQPSGANGWSMALEGFHVGVCFTQQATVVAYKSNRKLRLGEDGIFNCTDPKQKILTQQ